LHFDHTSILKTIARRFLSKNPPYMGARYAAAKDLSAVIGTRLRKPQFLPFIRYRFQFIASEMMLEVKGASAARGAVLEQGVAASNSIAQDFSFEDAGGGFVYIRSHVSNLYLTVQHLDTNGGGTSAAAAHMPSTTADAPPPGIIQDLKYAAGGGVGFPLPRFQKWKVTRVIGGVDLDSYWISSQAYPDKVLQPVDFNQPTSPVVLSDMIKTGGVIQGTLSAWKITSPLFGGGGTNAPPDAVSGPPAPSARRTSPSRARTKSRRRAPR
jgi:hypothetical protein